MKKLLLFIPIVLMLNSCGSLLSITIEGPSLYRQDLNQVDADADGWIARTIPPSQVTTSGDMFFEEKLSRGGSSFSVGGHIKEDETYWYNTLMQDSGWRTNTEDGWSQTKETSKRIKRGYLYINLKKRVAVYMHDDDTFNTFRVTIND
tara:strand:- start:916 stop:1359 length:444 start_codon:yes stop_codon:yes gene_type:complete